jgi:hypothetical protein
VRHIVGQAETQLDDVSLARRQGTQDLGQSPGAQNRADYLKWVCRLRIDDELRKLRVRFFAYRSLQTGWLLAELQQLTFWLRGTPPTDWLVSAFLATSLHPKRRSHPGWFAWRPAHPEIRRHRRWFVLFVFCSALFYIELKNVIARAAHVKEILREPTWKMTPRSAR